MILIQKIKKIKAKTWIKEIVLDVIFFTTTSTIFMIYLVIFHSKEPENSLILRSGVSISTTTEENHSISSDFVASSRGKYYYRVGSEKANSLSEKNKVYFKTAQEAEKLGFKPYFND